MVDSTKAHLLNGALKNSCNLCPQTNLWQSDISSKRVILRRGCLIIIDGRADGFWALDTYES